MPVLFAWGLVALILSAVSTALQFFLSPKPKDARPGKVDGLPITAQGTFFPVLFGRRRITPIVAWWGDVKTTKIKAKGK